MLWGWGMGCKMTGFGIFLAGIKNNTTALETGNY